MHRIKFKFYILHLSVKYGKESFLFKYPTQKTKKKLYSIILSMTHDHYMEYFFLIKCYNDSYRLIIDIVHLYCITINKCASLIRFSDIILQTNVIYKI
jgi:hypothetical protein